MPSTRKGIESRRNGKEDCHQLDGQTQSESMPVVLPGIDPRSFFQIVNDHVKRSYDFNNGFVEDWQTFPEVPSSAEIMSRPTINRSVNGSIDYTDFTDPSADPILPYNVVDSPWGSREQYIGAHYRLLREDAIAPLREAVLQFASNPLTGDTRSFCVYDHVHLTGYTFANIGPAPRVEFSYQRAGKRIRWQQSKRLQQGTMVALTPRHDMFKSICKVAIVAARPLHGVQQNPPHVDLFWGKLEEAEFDPAEEYIMVEARSGYFEATRHMLVALQKLMTESFPLSKQLASLEKSISPPQFIQNQPMKNLSSLSPTGDTDSSPHGNGIDVRRLEIENVNILTEWPSIPGSKLDSSQSAALRRILTKKLAIIHGPPGTGKTFVSISALKVMLENWTLGDPPILVSAQTNHALDQLLTLVSSFEPNYLRLGGRTSLEAVKERTLFQVRQEAPQRAKAPFVNFKNAKHSLDNHTDQLTRDIEKALAQDSSEAKLLLDLKIISQEQYDSLHDDEWIDTQDAGLPPGKIALWLGHQQLMTPQGCPQINVGFEEEEEDSEFAQLDETEVETGRKDDDDLDALNGTFLSLKEAFAGRQTKGYSQWRIKKILQTSSDLWDIDQGLRGEIYRYFRQEIKNHFLKSFRSHLYSYQRSSDSVKIARWQSDATLISRLGLKLIGCTTTGLSKYRGLLASLGPRTLLVEEAAETLEGTILAAMFESLEQLILIGDHQQLQAHCNVDVLENHPYNLAISMFERLVKNGMEYTMLNEQRRMIPEIRQLLNPFYPQLRDHHSVLDRINHRPSVPGMGCRDLYFFHHNWQESRDETASRFNIDEAAMIVGFFNYLVLNGVEPSQITVLTFYNGQRTEVLRQLRKHPELGPLCNNAMANKRRRVFNVFTVDSYQGEENDIILLSLVRSNDQCNIGFLENTNRAVVSLSRARRGLYIFGNAFNLRVSVWTSVIDTMKINQRLNFHSGLPIVCLNHAAETVIEDADGWLPLAGGCGIKCNGVLDCGHACPHPCHPFSHDMMLCKEPCARRLPCGHGCNFRCGDHCACTCDFAGHLRLSMFPNIKSDDWQQSLDEMIDDERRQPTTFDPFTTPKKEVCRTPWSESKRLTSSSNWRQWDGEQADKSLEITRRTQSPIGLSQLAQAYPAFKETYRSVQVNQGIRLRNKNDGTARATHPNIQLHSTPEPPYLLDLTFTGTGVLPNNHNVESTTSVFKGATTPTRRPRAATRAQILNSQDATFQPCSAAQVEVSKLPQYIEALTIETDDLIIFDRE